MRQQGHYAALAASIGKTGPGGLLFAWIRPWQAVSAAPDPAKQANGGCSGTFDLVEATALGRPSPCLTSILRLDELLHKLPALGLSLRVLVQRIDDAATHVTSARRGNTRSKISPIGFVGKEQMPLLGDGMDEFWRSARLPITKCWKPF